MQIYITTSNGVYKYNPSENVAQKIVKNKYSGFFKKRALGFFGICQVEQSGEIVVATREKLGTPKAGRPSTDTRLLAINPQNDEVRVLAEVKDVHDVHQIAAHDNHIFLTDTGKNRLIVYSIAQNRKVATLDVGPERADIHHINAVQVHNHNLHIGLNNRGTTESQILSLPLNTILQDIGAQKQIDILKIGKLQNLKGRSHTHDLFPHHDDFLVCASHEGEIFKATTGETLAHLDRWVRGLTLTPEGLWVGSSPIAGRTERHSERLNGSLFLLDKETFQVLNMVNLVGAAQVNDMMAI